ncbi:hypothetical protein IWW36_000913 [Coemansia brasiliensis]|uniref:Uncharacterized protein n=1 Tax=Coemansia brasiliensis TaxID=2650707 RepID=A0A9W8M2K0_9FUNG|nr:hypothetical protein IWW36_000913 [Coemansia brasiliensis]
MNNDCIRIGVLGEFGVGKFELVRQICHPGVQSREPGSSWSGPIVDIVDFQRPNSNQHVWVEFVIVPGETLHPRSRQMIYMFGFDALLVVCDCSVQRTLLRATEWMEEATAIDSLKGVPVALVLGGPVPIDWANTPTLDSFAETYNAKVLDLSGYTSSPTLEHRQQQLIQSFFETVIQHKASTRTM